MIIRISKSAGVVVEARELKLSVNPASNVSATLTLRTKIELPVVSAGPEIIQGPGEYEVAGIKVRGISLEKESSAKLLATAYIVDMDDLRLCFLPQSVKSFDEGFLDQLDEVDMYVKVLAEELGQSVESVDKLSIKKKDINEGETKLVWIKEK
ncbi:MAG: hypothetical protein HYR95_01725 [Candidatus Colwellbacteria bacterium]|nr:hypothetical protein [Candidatus Colwellbacteria bacterium]